ncbi:DUF4241 domain-containing protein [Kamptonema formosum]|uniref:DUF4241 domain-containing protein n=1 Tax=Kamptonema formosum TaxID=331992 RepID=UPI00035C9663|nr:DUF4241 domain-containing protein [Oscillatoria sp. PCC 10802]
MRIPNYFRLFQKVRTFNTAAGELTLTPKNIGKLVLPIGKLVACDPICRPESEAFTPKLKPGRYPVILCFADSPAYGGSKIACAMLRLKNIPPVRWELATSPHQDIRTLKKGQYFGYPVDSGMGCFMDAGAADVLIDGIELGNFQEDFADRVIDAMSESEWGNFLIDDLNGANVIAFSSGLGDGIYVTYFGYGAAGEIVCAVTDFNLFDADEAEALFD